LESAGLLEPGDFDRLAETLDRLRHFGRAVVQHCEALDALELRGVGALAMTRDPVLPLREDLEGVGDVPGLDQRIGQMAEMGRPPLGSRCPIDTRSLAHEREPALVIATGDSGPAGEAQTPGQEKREPLLARQAQLLLAEASRDL